MSSKASSHHSSSHHSHGRRRHKSAGRPLLVIHILNAIFSGVSLVLFVATIPLWNANFFHTGGLVKGDWPDCLPLIPLLATLSISLFYLVKQIVRRMRKEPHSAGDYLKTRTKHTTPLAASKVHTYIRLAILILLLAFLILAAISGLYRYWRSGMMEPQRDDDHAPVTLTLPYPSMRRSVPDPNPVGPALTPPTAPVPNSTSPNLPTTPSIHNCTLANIFTRRCNPTLYLIGELQIAAVATGGLAWLLNLILLTLQLREYQYQKRKLERSLRAKAKARIDHLMEEDDKISRSTHNSSKKIHHDSRRPRTPPDHVQTRDYTGSYPAIQQQLARPPRAATGSSTQRSEITLTSDATSVSRPKQHYYKSSISPSRRAAESEMHSSLTSAFFTDYSELYSSRTAVVSGQTNGQTPYARAVEEARRKVKPAEPMRNWMISRYNPNA